MHAEVRVDAVERAETRTGKTRRDPRDERGTEYTTFRPRIGEDAERHRGRRARIEYHEEDRNGFHNVYLDAIGEAPEDPQPSGGTDPDEVAWSTAVEAAPWVLGSRDPDGEIPPEELFEKLEPFKRLVAEDIREGGDS